MRSSNRANRPDKTKILQLVWEGLIDRDHARPPRPDPNNKNAHRSAMSKPVSIRGSSTKKKRGEVKLGGYISKIVKMMQSGEQEGDRLTASSAAIAEVGLLVEHAIKNVTFNAGAILKYNGAETIDLKTVSAATATAFSGPLKASLLKGGEAAVISFDNHDAAAAPAVATH